MIVERWSLLITAKLGSWNKLGLLDEKEHEVEHCHVDEDGLTCLEEFQLPS